MERWEDGPHAFANRKKPGNMAHKFLFPFPLYFPGSCSFQWKLYQVRSQETRVLVPFLQISASLRTFIFPSVNRAVCVRPNAMHLGLLLD